jgi:enoyl-CoA hydratase
VIRLRTDGPVATITIDRPDRRNAISREMVRALLDAVATVAGDDEVRVVVVEGVPGAFSAGTDLSEPGEIEPAHDEVFDAMVSARSWWPLVECPKPVVAAIDGPAIGLGVELASHCDIRIATTRATFVWNFVHRGLVPDTGAGTWLLPRQIGLSQALRVLYRGEPVDAAEALALGFVARVVEPGELASAVAAEVDALLAVSPLSLRLLKPLVYDGLGRDFRHHLASHVEALRECFHSDDHREGTAAFFEKRPPRFTGR